MKLSIELTYKENYFPASNAREEEKFHYVTKDVGKFDLEEVEDSEFLVACIIESQRGKQTVYRYKDDHFWKRSIRTVNMYKSSLERWGAVDEAIRRQSDAEFEKCKSSAIVLGDTRALSIADINDDLDRHCVFNGELWEQTGEPYYVLTAEDEGKTLVVDMSDVPQSDAMLFCGYNINDFDFVKARADAFEKDGGKVIYDNKAIEIGLPDKFNLGKMSGDFEASIHAVAEKEWKSMMGEGALSPREDELSAKALEILQESIVLSLKERLKDSFRPEYRYTDDDIRLAIISVIGNALVLTTREDETKKREAEAVARVEQVKTEAKAEIERVRADAETRIAQANAATKAHEKRADALVQKIVHLMEMTHNQIDVAVKEWQSSVSKVAEKEPVNEPEREERPESLPELSSLNLHLSSKLNEDRQKDVDKTNQIVQQGIGKEKEPEISSAPAPENHDSEPAPEVASSDSSSDSIDKDPVEKPEVPQSHGKRLIDLPNWLK